MNIERKKIVLVVVVIITAMFASCYQDLNPPTELMKQQQFVKIQINVAKTGFERDNTTRSGSSDTGWEDGEIIYLRFVTNEGVTIGNIVYKAETADWTLTCEGSMTHTVNSKVEAYYFDHPETITENGIIKQRPTATTGIYYSSDGVYSYSANGELKIALDLKPITGRLRFKGEPGKQIVINDYHQGIKYYSQYSFSDDNSIKAVESAMILELTVNSDGYTPYIYGWLNKDMSSIKVVSDSYNFTRDCPNTMLQVGESGWLSIPTEESHNGWEMMARDPLGLCPDANHPHMIDMGTSVKFACCNVGANTPIEYGGYYAWGETSTKSTYDWNTYKWCNGTYKELTKYTCYDELYDSYPVIDYLSRLESVDDAASVNWGNIWRMPTIEEFSELVTSCIWEEATIIGVLGNKVTASNGNRIFFPATGFIFSDGIHYEGKGGCYWSSSLHKSFSPWAFYLSSFNSVSNNTIHDRYIGQSVRAVTTRVLEDKNDGCTRSFTVKGNGKTVTFNMKRVEAGTFQMGSTTGASNETPVHTVTLTREYYLGETEVTQALWYAVMGESPMLNNSAWSSEHGLGDRYPAYNITYNDCQSFLAKLNQLTGETFRLPTEAEWEFAAKGGNKTLGYTYSGSNTIDDVAWYSSNSKTNDRYSTHLVKMKQPNELGLYDMSGNVQEFCIDWYTTYTADTQIDPAVTTQHGTDHVVRGGDYFYPASGCTPAARSNFSDGYGRHWGIRLAMYSKDQ